VNALGGNKIKERSVGQPCTNRLTALPIRLVEIKSKNALRISLRKAIDCSAKTFGGNKIKERC